MFDLIELPQALLTEGIIHNIIASALVLLVVLAMRAVAMRFVRRFHFPTDDLRLRWHVRIRNLTLLLILLGFGIVWATELRTLALSFVAIAAAIVIATKELILCISGGVLRASTESFSVGDRIEVHGIRGDVVNYGLMTTTILEIGPSHQRTGRAIVIPNALLLSNEIINETFTDTFVLHTFTVPVAFVEDWESHEADLLGAARKVCRPYVEDARHHMEALSQRHGLSASSTEPRVTLQVAEADILHLLVRVPTPAGEKGRTEQEILRRYLRSRSAAMAAAAGNAAPAGAEPAPPAEDAPLAGPAKQRPPATKIPKDRPDEEEK